MKRNDIQIVEITTEDISTIKKIETESGLSSWSEKDYLNEIKKTDSFAKIVSFENEIIGFILARLITNKSGFLEKKNQAEIYNIAVKKKVRKKGVGSFLLNELINICRELCISEIWLEVRKSNSAARDFYSKHGFEKVSERKLYYTNPFEDAVIMKRILQNDEIKMKS